MNKQKLPEGWKEVELGEIADFVNGRAFKPSEWEKDGKLIIRIQDLTGSIDKPNYSTKVYDEKYLVKNGDLLISWSATLGAYIWRKEDGWLNQHIFKVVENPKLVDKNFIYYLINLKIEELKKLTHGSTMKHITKGDFTKSKIVLPPIQTQKKIVSLLEKAEKAKEWRKEADDLTKDFLKSVFLEMFCNGKYEEVELKEICDTSSGGTPSRSEKKYWNKGNIPWIKSGDLNKNQITEVDEFITEEGLKNSSAKYIEPNTILIAMYGATAGKCSISRIKATTNQAVCAIVPKKDNLNKNYLLYWLRSIYDKIVALAFGGGQPNISQQVVRSLKIPLPPIELQNKFASIVKEVEAMKEQQKHSKNHIDKLFNALMQKAFKGELII